MKRDDIFFAGMILFGLGGLILVSYLAQNGFFGEYGSTVHVASFLLCVFVMLKNRKRLRGSKKELI